MISNKILRRVGGQFAAQALHNQRQPGKLLDCKTGLGMLRSRTIPGSLKLTALALGIGLTVGVEMLEMPLETLVAVLLPGIGLAANFVMDGMEAVILPILFASLAMPHLAKRHMVPAAVQSQSNNAPKPEDAEPPVIDYQAWRKR